MRSMSWCTAQAIRDDGSADDGNTQNGDGCDNNCTNSACGNGVLAPNEACDDGNTNNADDCEADCTSPFCGNGILDLGEFCDDGNTSDGDACESNCTPSACGNGIVDANEQCDSRSLRCNESCLRLTPSCGDGVLQPGEACDDNNNQNADGCEADCSLPACNNGVLDPGEFCFGEFTDRLSASGFEQTSADFNGDRSLDVAGVDGNSAQIDVLLNNGNGTFQELVVPFVEIPKLVAGGDFNQDGLADLAVFDQSDSLSVLLRIDGGGFASQPPIATGILIEAMTAVDLNEDGRLDLATSNGNFISAGDGTFPQRLPLDPVDFQTSLQDLATGDINEDGHIDVVVLHQFFSQGIDIYLGDGTGTSPLLPVNIPNVAGNDVLVVDANQDSHLDILTDTVQVFLGNGDTTFQPRQTFASGSAQEAVASDFDGDGFTDVAVALNDNSTAAVLYGLGNGGFGAPTPLNFNGNALSLVALEANHDGKPDLIIGANAGTPVALNLGNRVFQRSITSITESTVTIDLNHDRADDIVESGFSTVNSFLGIAHGTFSLPTTVTAIDPFGIPVSADFNLDGHQDIAIAAQFTTTITVLMSHGDGSFAAPVEFSSEETPQSMIAGDVNLDGRDDLIQLSDLVPGIEVFLSLGDGSFVSGGFQALSNTALDIQAADLDGDARIDLVVAQTNNEIVVLFASGGTASLTTGASSPGALAVTDFNNDGNNDTAAFLSNGDILFFPGNGDSTFGAALSPIDTQHFNAIKRLVPADLNLDGAVDLVLGSSSFSVLLGNGDGTFQGELIRLANASAGSISTGDTNADGAPDILLTGGNGTHLFLSGP